MTDASADDLDLASRARDGDLDSFNILVERYQTGVFNLCLRMVGSTAAEDAAQEAFISAYRHLDRFRGGSFKAWVFRIAANACYDEFRRRRARPAVSLDRPAPEGSAAFDAPDDSPSLEAQAANVELRGALQAALLELPEDQRLVVVLCDVQGLDYSEIAAVMQTSLGTVKSRLSRARGRLRRVLSQRPELLPDSIRHTGEDI